MARTKVKIHQLTDGTDGELITWDASGVPTTVAVGTTGHVLTSNGVGAAPTFQAAPVAEATTASNGLNLSTLDVRLGGSLTSVTTITGNTTNYLTVTGARTAADAGSLHVNNTGASGPALKTLASGTGAGVWGESTTGTGVYGSSGSISVGGYSTGTVGTLFTMEPASTNTVAQGMILDRNTTGTAADGIGNKIFFRHETSTSANQSANSIVSKWATATHASRLSEISFTGYDVGVENTLLSLLGTGKATLNKYGVGSFTGTAAYTLQVDSSGNIIEGTPSGGSGDISNGGNTTGAAITIGTNDEYDLNLKTDGITRINITGGTTTGGKTTITETTATTNDIEHALTISSNSTGTGAVGFGTGMYFKQKSTTVEDQFAATITTPWTTATHIFRTADLVIKTTYQGVLAEGLRVVSDTNPLVRIQGKLQFAGATSSFPMLKQSSAILQVRLADDSAHTDLEVADEAYGVGWNGSLEVPTKNALYDKIQTLGGTLSDADYGDITVSGVGTIMTIDNSVVTLSKIANAGANSKLLGSGSAGSGSAYSEITLGSDLTMTSTTLSVTQATSSLAGKVELATTAETTNGADTSRVVTPKGLAASIYGAKSVAILISDPNGDVLTTGDGKAYFRIDDYVTGMDLVGVGASVSTVSSSGTPTVQIRRVRSGTPVDMLSTALTIDVSETDSSTATTTAVINTSNDDTLTGDQIYIDVDVAGTGTKGLCVTLNFQTP